MEDFVRLVWMEVGRGQGVVLSSVTLQRRANTNIDEMERTVERRAIVDKKIARGSEYATVIGRYTMDS